LWYQTGKRTFSIGAVVCSSTCILAPEIVSTRRPEALTVRSDPYMAVFYSLCIAIMDTALLVPISQSCYTLAMSNGVCQNPYPSSSPPPLSYTCVAGVEYWHVERTEALTMW